MSVAGLVGYEILRRLGVTRATYYGLSEGQITKIVNDLVAPNLVSAVERIDGSKSVRRGIFRLNGELWYYRWDAWRGGMQLKIYDTNGSDGIFYSTRSDLIGLTGQLKVPQLMESL